MKKRYATFAFALFALSLLYLFQRQVAAAQHEKNLRSCIKKFESVRAEAAKIQSTNLYPFQKQRWNFVWVSDFVDGLAVFSGTKENREQKGIVDFNGNIVLEFQGAHVEYFNGFENGRTRAYVYEHEAVPWGFLLPYGNPVPRTYGYLDCTGTVTLDK